MELAAAALAWNIQNPGDPIDTNPFHPSYQRAMEAAENAGRPVEYRSLAKSTTV